MSSSGSLYLYAWCTRIGPITAGADPLTACAIKIFARSFVQASNVLIACSEQPVSLFQDWLQV